MTRLPMVSGRQVVRALAKIGYELDRQRGSHISLRCPGRPPVTVPDHPEVGRGTLRNILQQAELTPEEFLMLLGR